jgi:hypothetical protein
MPAYPYDRHDRDHLRSLDPRPPPVSDDWTRRCALRHRAIMGRLGLQLTPYLGLAGTSTRPPPASCDGTIRLGIPTGCPTRNGDRPPGRLAWTLARNAQLLAAVLGMDHKLPSHQPYLYSALVRLL